MDDTENLRILRDMAMGRDVSAGDRVMAANWAVREIEKAASHSISHMGSSFLTREEISLLALDGFSISTMHGQASHKLMPISDIDTLDAFARAVIAAHEAKQPTGSGPVAGTVYDPASGGVA